MLFKRNKRSDREAMLGLDLGTGYLKAAILRRQGAKLELAEYAVRRLPPGTGTNFKDQQVAAELQKLMDGLKLQDRRAIVSISCSSAMVCQTEFPRMPLDEVKTALKLNSTKYLRRDFSNYHLDAVELLPPGTVAKKSGRDGGKMNVLVAGASKDEVAGYREALTAAKIRPEVLELAAVSVINAFQFCQPDAAEQVVLLVDVGARSTTINFIRQGQPIITRIMQFGGEQLNEQIAQTFMLQPAEAEDEKIKMGDTVQMVVKAALLPLAREIRSSLDFFERQQDCHVGRVFACGGSACAPLVLTALSEEVGVTIEAWNPVAMLGTDHFNGEKPALQSIGPSLAVAVGAAAGRL